MEKRYHRHVAYIHTYIYQLIEKETQGETEETSNTYTLRERREEKRPREEAAAVEGTACVVGKGVEGGGEREDKNTQAKIKKRRRGKQQA